MNHFRKNLPNLNSLIIFESAGRNGSYALASEELGLSQPAISISIKKLESYCNLVLFNRNKKGVVMTEAGLQLYKASEKILSDFETELLNITKKNQTQPVNFCCSTSFANYWLVPRLHDIKSTLPEIDLRVQTTIKDLDWAYDEYSFGLARGVHPPERCNFEFFCDEVIYPVVSHNFKGDLNSNDSLVHLEEPYRIRPNWQNYAQAQNLPIPNLNFGLKLNDQSLVMQAVIAGQGVGLVWQHIAHNLIEQNIIKQTPLPEWHTGAKFYLIWKQNKKLNKHELRFKEWFMSHKP